MNLFRAAEAATVNIAVSSSTQRVKIGNPSKRIQVRVCNCGTATAWIAFGDVTVAASASTGIPIAANSAAGFSVDPPTTDALYVAVIAVGATGSVYFTPGVGI